VPEHPESRDIHPQLAACFCKVTFHKVVYSPCDKDGANAYENDEYQRSEVSRKPADCIT